MRLYGMPKKRSDSRTKEKKQDLEETLVKNLVELQKVHTDLAEKFDNLSKEISQILNLFENAARSFSKNVPSEQYKKDEEFLNKIDKLLEQNKTIAKGLILMEDRMKDRMHGKTNPTQPKQQNNQMQPPQFKQQSQGERNNEGYQPSIGSENRPLPRF